MIKWTKKSIKVMQGTLSTFYLINRPLSGIAPPEFLVQFRACLANNRVKIVLAGLREHIAIARERAVKDDATAMHFEKNPKIYGDSTPEMVARFRESAREESKAIEWEEKLIARIETHGLPPEVCSFDPSI